MKLQKFMQQTTPHTETDYVKADSYLKEVEEVEVSIDLFRVSRYQLNTNKTNRNKNMSNVFGQQAKRVENIYIDPDDTGVY
jgi:hypothetical protein